MADTTKATPKEHAIEKRGTEDPDKVTVTKKRSTFVATRGARGFETRVYQVPEVTEIKFAEEEPIRPDPQLRKQQVRQEAESVLKKASKGQHFKDDYLDKLEQRLDKSGSARDLGGAVGQLRASQRAKEETRMTSGANRGLDVSTKDKPPAQAEAAGVGGGLAAKPEEPPEIVFPDPNPSLAGIGVVRRQFEARALTNRFGKGEEITAQEARRAAERLLAAERQGAIYGKGSEDLGQVVSLGDITFKQLERAIEEVRESEGKGARAQGSYRTSLAREALGMERQYQLLGKTSSAGDLASRLGDIKRADIQNDIQAVLDKAQRKERSGGAYIDYLQENLIGSGRQLQLLGRSDSSSEAMLELARALGKSPRLPLAEEARQVIDGLGRGHDLDDEYVDFLRRRLVESSDSETRQLATALRQAQTSRLVSEVRTTLGDARKGKRFAEFYITYLQRRLAEAVAEETSQDKKTEWTTLSQALDELIRRAPPRQR